MRNIETPEKMVEGLQADLTPSSASPTRRGTTMTVEPPVGNLGTPRRHRLRACGGDCAARKLTAWLFLAPNLIGFSLFTLIPVAASLVLSFYTWDLFTPARFAGLRNYRMLLHDGDFYHALGNTLFLMLQIRCRSCCPCCWPSL